MTPTCQHSPRLCPVHMHTAAPCTQRTQKMRTEMLGMVDGMSAYHLLRGATVEKVTKTPSKSTDEESKVAVEGDKTTNSHRGMLMPKGLQSWGRQTPRPPRTALGAGRSARLPPSGRGACRLGRGNSVGLGLQSGSARHAEFAASHHQVEQDHQDERIGVGAAPRLR